MIRVGLVGAGKIAESFHLPAWKKIDGAQVVAISDLDSKRAARLAERHNIPSHYSNLKKMIQRETLDILAVLTPNALHAEHIQTALDAGIHCVVEKPLVTDFRQIDRIQELSRKKNLKVMCAQHQRFRPPTRAVMPRVATELGQVYFGRAQALYARRVPPQNDTFTLQKQGGGSLLDLGSHILDVAWWMMGCPAPDRVTGATFSRLAHQTGITNELGSWKSFDVEESAFAQIHFKIGAILNLEVSYLLNIGEDVFQVELCGTAGGLIWPSLSYTTDREGIRVRDQWKSPDDELASVAQLGHFVECVKSGREPLITLDQSREVIRMLNAVHKSARTKKEVRL